MANRCSCRQLSVISSFAVASFVSASRYGGPGRCQSAQLPSARDANRGKVDTAGRHVRQIKLCLPHRQIVIECGRARALKFATDATRSPPHFNRKKKE